MAGSSELSARQAGFRFLIELAALAAWGIAGWHVTDSPLRWPLAFILPVVAAAAWGTFRAPGDASANGGAPVPVDGIVRLAIEAVVLLGGGIAVAVLWRPWIGVGLCAAVLLHYALALNRVRWLLTRRRTDRG